MQFSHLPIELLIAFLLLVILFLSVIVFYFWNLHTFMPRPSDEIEPCKYALLLGCPSADNGMYTTSQILRCNLAIEAYQKGLYDVLIISGSNAANTYVEADEMADYISCRVNIPIIKERKAKNTWQNFEYTKKIIGDQPLLILTTTIHGRRAYAIAKQFFSHCGLCTIADNRLKVFLMEASSRMKYFTIERHKQRTQSKDWQ